MKFLLEVLHCDAKEIHQIYLQSIRLRDSVDLVTAFDHIYEVASFKKIELPEKAVELFEALKNPTPKITQVANYLATRGEKVMVSSDFYYLDDQYHEMNERLIIPFYHNDELVGWTARHINPGSYINKYQSEQPNGYLFNNQYLEDFDSEYVILVEGPMDALSINACAYLGDTPNRNQINWINSIGKKVILLADRSKSGWPAIGTAIENNWNVTFPDWDKDIKDANEAVLQYGSIWTVKNILENITSGEVRIKQRFKLWLKG